ncbi:hypothetical protein WME95_50570 [Sorangium sp. So ce327]|uniref:hypothetical protein n=1 Tax=Sorangium sp. So ce327 TaxID=3133301 RepID=UPI003F5DB938
MASKAELILDLVQFALDLVGLVDPTFISDGASGLISLARGQWLDAVISGASMIPYVGDMMKLGKLPRYARSIAEAIALAREDAKLADQLRPALAKLLEALNRLPADKLPRDAMAPILQMKREIEAFLSATNVLWKQQLTSPALRKYAPTPKHAGRGGPGVKGTIMDLDDAQARQLLQSALHDAAAPLRDKAPRLWGYRNGKVYQFHYDNAGGWHGFSDDVKPPDYVIQQWRATKAISEAEFNRVRKLPNRGF